ncbi:hypothetical protein PsorP6_004552 [Peronosclerospora sorghi]|uniref:Uncharacterized protein n=1 Tax=Peronosclerospora sorghi TaxID=230839 RepID=A0ACC0VML9_9STRA|nr:hypothetical protein PsorP6_004552 [Peronosclerospora sorghi]
MGRLLEIDVKLTSPTKHAPIEVHKISTKKEPQSSSESFFSVEIITPRLLILCPSRVFVPHLMTKDEDNKFMLAS